MNRQVYDTNLERFVLGAAMFLMMLWAGLAVINYFNEDCPGGWQLLTIPCQDPNDDPQRC